MKCFFSIFKKKKKCIAPDNVEASCETMEDQPNVTVPDTFTLCKVWYSKNKRMRYVLVKSDRGFYTYYMERHFYASELEWPYSHQCWQDEWWDSDFKVSRCPQFKTQDEAIAALMKEKDYCQYFV